ncbi:MAG: hypothetical protein WCO60_11490 [Verrucomicrobiota bacterium]
MEESARLLNHRGSWRIEDPAPEVPLPEIQLISDRTKALIFRSSSPLLESDFVQIYGVTTILAGLEHHFTNFMTAFGQLRSIEEPFPHAILHEAVAWLNRVGQLNAFRKSSLITKHVPMNDAPTIEYVMPFRNKHAAHRSVDDPKRSEDAHTRPLHALMFSDLGWRIWTPREAGQLPGIDIKQTHYLAFQIRLNGPESRNLVIERDHPKVLKEGYKLIEALLRLS